MSIYKGFSTVNKVAPPFEANDIELVKIDLLNHFNTRRGDRVMMPNFGTVIHDLIMDPLDQLTTDQILDDVKRIISYDPRVRLIDAPVLSDMDYVVRVDVELYFVAQDTAEHLYFDFLRRNSEE